ncbi:MAG: type II toxin-antitoxin system HicB family antitoxin [Anaerolineae bacterium]
MKNEEIVLDKDDRDLVEMVKRGKEMRREKGVSESTQDYDARHATLEWHQLRETRTPIGTYYVVIEYKDSAYCAHALSFPEVTAHGKTMEAVREKVAEALRAHFAGLRARGEVVPLRENKRVEAVEVSLEEMQPVQPAEVTIEIAPAPHGPSRSIVSIRTELM